MAISVLTLVVPQVSTVEQLHAVPLSTQSQFGQCLAGLHRAGETVTRQSRTIILSAALDQLPTTLYPHKARHLQQLARIKLFSFMREG